MTSFTPDKKERNGVTVVPWYPWTSAATSAAYSLDKKAKKEVGRWMIIKGVHVGQDIDIAKNIEVDIGT